MKRILILMLYFILSFNLFGQNRYHTYLNPVKKYESHFLPYVPDSTVVKFVGEVQLKQPMYVSNDKEFTETFSKFVLDNSKIQDLFVEKLKSSNSTITRVLAEVIPEINKYQPVNMLGKFYKITPNDMERAVILDKVLTGISVIIFILYFTLAMQTGKRASLKEYGVLTLHHVSIGVGIALLFYIFSLLMLNQDLLLIKLYMG